MSEPHLMGQDATNAVLVGCLTRLGWTPEQFAYHLNRLARSLRPAVPEIHPKTPRRWLAARAPSTWPCLPRQPWPGLVCSLLSRHLQEPVTLASLGWQTSAGALYVPADDGLHHPWHPHGTIASLREVLEARGMDRRHFVVLTGTGLTTFAHDWMLDPQRVAAAARGQRVDHAVVDDLERVADARRRLDDRFGGAMVFRAVREDLLLVTEMLDNARYTEEIGQRLYAVAAEFARIAGLRAYDNNDEALAQRYFIAGLRAAHSSADRAIGANILTFMSMQARDHDPRDAVRLAESALAGAKDLTPAMEARIQASLAKSAARAGDAATAARAQGRMFERTAAVDPAAEPPYIYWWSEAEAHAHAGSSALLLGNPRQAEAHYRDALARIAPSFPRDRLSHLSRLALARVQLRELDGACRAATEAGTLLRRHDSPRKRARLAAFRKAAQLYATTTQVKDFDAKFATCSAPPQPDLRGSGCGRQAGSAAGWCQAPGPCPYTPDSNRCLSGVTGRRPRWEKLPPSTAVGTPKGQAWATMSRSTASCCAVSRLNPAEPWPATGGGPRRPVLGRAVKTGTPPTSRRLADRRR